MLGEFVHRFLVTMMHLERRTEPFWRPYANAVFREPTAAVLQALINLRRRDEGLQLAEEKLLPGEEQALDKIVRDMGAYMMRKYRPGEFQRVGNTKTHGLVRAEFTIRDDLPAELRHGVFREPRTFPAWVRFSGPGPDSPPDIDDVGFLSMSIKLMDVPGPKLSDDERFTQDFLAVCTPTFVSGNARANAELHAQSYRLTPLFYFFDPRHSHILDFLMQALWNETQTSPLECQYFSCTAFLLGQGRAMKFSMRPRSQAKSPIPNLPGRPPDHYLRDNMQKTLGQQDAVFDFLIQLQTDPHAMPIEDAAVRWPEKLSPWVPAATIRIPKQRFDSAAQLRFVETLRYNPWHCIPEHRPLGNMNRVRKRMYETLSNIRLTQNRAPHYEPNGRETFAEAAPPPIPEVARQVPVRVS
jgi:hypothetical protein